VECSLRGIDVVSLSTVISTCISLGEVIALYMSGISSKPFPINFIEIIGLKDESGNDSSSGSSFQNGSNSSKEEKFYNQQNSGDFILVEASVGACPDASMVNFKPLLS
jgi:hypothetical protein